MTNRSTPESNVPTRVEEHHEISVMEVLAHYAAAGFDGDAFVTAGGRMKCGSCDSLIAPTQVDIHSIRRLEGASDPSDMVGVIAMICPVCKSRLTAVLKYGPEASEDETAVWHLTHDLRSSNVLSGNMAPGEDQPDFESQPPVA